jgi:hypothetical protein
MSTGGVIALVIGGIAVIFLLVNRGLVNAGVPVGHGIVAPQPSSNYGGYLAATTAPQVSGLLSTVLSGVTSAAHSWLSSNPPSSNTPAPNQSASASSPSLSAQPVGPNPGFIASGGILAAGPLGPSDSGMGWMIGPQVDPTISYNATPANAFDYTGLAYDNSYDPNASLSLA